MKIWNYIQHCVTAQVFYFMWFIAPSPQRAQRYSCTVVLSGVSTDHPSVKSNEALSALESPINFFKNPPNWLLRLDSVEKISVPYTVFLCATDPCYKGNCCAILACGRESILSFMTEGRLNHILDVLRSQQILSRTDYETITSFPTVTSRARALLDTCLGLGENAAQTVVAVLSASKCSPLARGVWTNTVNWMAFSTACCSQMSPETVTVLALVYGSLWPAATDERVSQTSA